MNSRMSQIDKIQSLESSVIIAGKFNPFIFSPDWITNYLGPTKEIRLNFGLLSRGVSLIIDGCSFTVEAERIVIKKEVLALLANENDSKRLVEIAEQILTRLPHTPVEAIGNNFVFEFAKDDWNGATPALTGVDDNLLSEPLVRTWTGRFRDGSEDAPVYRIVSVSAFKEGIKVDFNNHRDIQSCAKGLSALGMFQQDWEVCKQLCMKLAKQEITE